MHYRTCVLQIKRQGYLVWDGMELGSGFDIQLAYSKNIKVPGDVIGLNDDYDLTPTLARFLAYNRELIPGRLKFMEKTIFNYRRHHRAECRRKHQVLTYRFLSHVYDQPRDPSGLAESSIEFEQDPRVRRLMAGSGAVFEASYERLASVSRSEAATWWYIFWVGLNSHYHLPLLT